MITSRLLLMAVLLSCLLMAIGAATIMGGLLISMDLPILNSSLGGHPAAAGPVSGPPAVQPAPRVGSVAPDFTLSTVDGQQLQLSGLRGKPVMVNFWATWCGPCNAEMPNIEKAYENLEGRDAVLLAVDQGDRVDEVKGFADIYRLRFPILMDADSKIGYLFRVQALPTTVFMGRDGTIHEIHVGGPMSTDFVETRMQALSSKTQ